jgi:hypothetical protein
MRRIAWVAALMPLVLSAPASASLPPAHPPAKRVAGVRVTWPPLETVTAGTVVGVKVESTRRRSEIAFVRVDGAGHPLKTLVRDTMLSGTFSVTVPQGPAGAHYMLRLVVGGKRYWSWLTTPAAAAAAAPVVIPAPQPQPQGCSGAAAAGELRLGATSVARGGVLPYQLVNTGCGNAWVSPGWKFERQNADGSWTGVPTGLFFPSVVEQLTPGAAYSEQAQIPADAAPGAYRLLDTLIGGGGPITVSAPFAVTG